MLASCGRILFVFRVTLRSVGLSHSSPPAYEDIRERSRRVAFFVSCESNSPESHLINMKGGRGIMSQWEVKS